jgi:hypothetical protein
LDEAMMKTHGDLVRWVGLVFDPCPRIVRKPKFSSPAPEIAQHAPMQILEEALGEISL